MTNLLSRIFVKNYDMPNNPHVRKSYGTFASIVGILINLLLAAIKLTLGFITLSVAIMADALNNLSDAGSSIITLVSFKLSAKPADRDHPFGHARIEYIASMIVSLLILLVGFEMLTDSAQGLLGLSEEKIPDFSTVSIIILGASIFFKLWLAVFYRKIGKKIDSGVIKASGTDSLTDCISTAAVLISSIIVKLTGFHKLDFIIGLLVSVLILIAGIKILNETKNSLLGEAPVGELVDKVKALVERYPEVVGIHDLMIHNYGPSHYIASFHAEVNGNEDIYILHDVIDNIEKQIQHELGILCTIHMDPINTDDATVKDLYEFLMESVKSAFAYDVSVHDFRVVVGATHTNLIFDIVVPFEAKEKPEEIIEKIETCVSSKRQNVFCVITVDRG